MSSCLPNPPIERKGGGGGRMKSGIPVQRPGPYEEPAPGVAHALAFNSLSSALDARPGRQRDSRDGLRRESSPSTSKHGLDKLRTRWRASSDGRITSRYPGAKLFRRWRNGECSRRACASLRAPHSCCLGTHPPPR